MSGKIFHTVPEVRTQSNDGTLLMNTNRINMRQQLHVSSKRF